MAAPEEGSRTILQGLDDRLPAMSKKDLEELKAAVEMWNLSEAASKAQEALGLSKNTELKIAVMGESGCGKLSFVIVIRDLADDSEGTARVGITEMTMKPTSQLHPKLPKVRRWDLPGIRMSNLQVGFACYEFFIIIALKCFRSCNSDLAQEIQKMERKFLSEDPSA